ncbi:MAG TPA: zinc-dependent alcohol dehydrogenase family protein [Nitriliruptorales bacterium]|nr:zinc-dependent alcohol dehydrogenase family protein [Nitriliruptorales bacterium]
MGETMYAWRVEQPAPIDQDPLRRAEVAVPEPGPDEVRVQVSVCGVCRTDLHVAEGDLPVRRPGVIPGHEVVGTVEATGSSTQRFTVGDRIGIAWLRRTCGRCRFCRRGDENLCTDPSFTGWTADGGYAQRAVVPEAWAYPVPDRFDDEQAAPLLCAGIIGYRALQRANVPPGGRLGLYGFGASAHLTAQLARAQGTEVHVVTRSSDSRRLARELGASWVGGPDDSPPEPLDAAIIFAPAGELVPTALAALDRGGTLALAGIHMTDVPPLDYDEHLFQERQVRSVTANTRADGDEFLRLAARIGVELTVTTYPFDAADRALRDLAHGRYAGVAVLEVAAE